jgi:hypothetical protein
MSETEQREETPTNEGGEQEDEAEAKSEREKVNDPLTRTTARAPRTPWGKGKTAS